MCLRRVDGRWRIVHDHSSVPFYLDGSYRAAVELGGRPTSIQPRRVACTQRREP
jgi:hypothetical protein